MKYGNWILMGLTTAALMTPVGCGKSARQAVDSEVTGAGNPFPPPGSDSGTAEPSAVGINASFWIKGSNTTYQKTILPDEGDSIFKVGISAGDGVTYVDGTNYQFQYGCIKFKVLVNGKTVTPGGDVTLKPEGAYFSTCHTDSNGNPTPAYKELDFSNAINMDGSANKIQVTNVRTDTRCLYGYWGISYPYEVGNYLNAFNVFMGMFGTMPQGQWCPINSQYSTHKIHSELNIIVNGSGS